MYKNDHRKILLPPFWGLPLIFSLLFPPLNISSRVFFSPKSKPPRTLKHSVKPQFNQIFFYLNFPPNWFQFLGFIRMQNQRMKQQQQVLMQQALLQQQQQSLYHPGLLAAPQVNFFLSILIYNSSPWFRCFYTFFSLARSWNLL